MLAKQNRLVYAAYSSLLLSVRNTTGGLIRMDVQNGKLQQRQKEFEFSVLKIIEQVNS